MIGLHFWPSHNPCKVRLMLKETGACDRARWLICGVEGSLRRFYAERRSRDPGQIAVSVAERARGLAN